MFFCHVLMGTFLSPSVVVTIPKCWISYFPFWPHSPRQIEQENLLSRDTEIKTSFIRGDYMCALYRAMLCQHRNVHVFCTSLCRQSHCCLLGCSGWPDTASSPSMTSVHAQTHPGWVWGHAPAPLWMSYRDTVAVSVQPLHSNRQRQNCWHGMHGTPVYSLRLIAPCE